MTPGSGQERPAKGGRPVSNIRHRPLNALLFSQQPRSDINAASLFACAQRSLTRYPCPSLSLFAPPSSVDPTMPTISSPALRPTVERAPGGKHRPPFRYASTASKAPSSSPIGGREDTNTSINNNARTEPPSDRAVWSGMPLGCPVCFEALLPIYFGQPSRLPSRVSASRYTLTLSRWRRNLNKHSLPPGCHPA